MVTLRCGTLPK